MAGLGAPLCSQANTTVSPSVTVWSDGGNVKMGPMPETQREHEREKVEVTTENRKM